MRILPTFKAKLVALAAAVFVVGGGCTAGNPVTLTGAQVGDIAIFYLRNTTTQSGFTVLDAAEALGAQTYTLSWKILSSGDLSGFNASANGEYGIWRGPTTATLKETLVAANVTNRTFTGFTPAVGSKGAAIFAACDSGTVAPNAGWTERYDGSISPQAGYVHDNNAYAGGSVTVTFASQSNNGHMIEFT